MDKKKKSPKKYIQKGNRSSVHFCHILTQFNLKDMPKTPNCFMIYDNIYNTFEQTGGIYPRGKNRVCC